MAEPVRVLICRSNPVAPDPRVEKIAKALAEAGYELTILGWDMKGEFPEEKELSGIPCYRLDVPVKPVRGLMNLAYELRWQLALLGWLWKNRRKFDLIHACDFDTVLPALLVKFIFGKVVLYDIFDFYADMLRAVPGIIKRLIRRVDLAVINRVDAVILADDVRLEQIAGSNPMRLAVIYNSPEDQALQAGENAAAQAEPVKLKIAYVGNLQIERGLIELIAVLEKHPEYSLDLAGFGGDEKEILARARKLANITWHGLVSYQRSLELAQLSDVMIATYSPQIRNHRYSSPNKVFEAMMLGKPIIVARGTNADRIVEDRGMGLVVDYGDIDSLEMALKKMSEDRQVRSELGKNARRAYEQTYSWQLMKQRLKTFYDSLVVECGLR